MESRRKKKWDNSRRSQNRRPPRVSWQPTMPSWEKDFCKVVGCLDWETLLQMKKFMHLYEDVIKWDDSAGEEAFRNAKKRFWAAVHGFACDTALPDPDLYIDEVNWDSEPNAELLFDLECEPVISNTLENHDPVIIFGDSLFPTEAYSSTGWGDNEDEFKAPANSSSVNHVDPWEQNWVGSFGNGAATGRPDCSNTGWQMNDGTGNAGYMTWGGGRNNDWGWNYGVGPDFNGEGDNSGQGAWNDENIVVDAGGYVSAYKPSNVPWNDGYKDQNSWDDEGQHKMTQWGDQSGAEHGPASREWNSLNPLSPHAAIAVGQTWNQ